MRSIRDQDEVGQGIGQPQWDGARMHWPADLPIAARRTEIAEAIARHQVTVIQADTGSGKTTQIPKICLAMGRAACGPVCLTQPRRIAARSVAVRIAQELGVAVGSAVGYQVRFDARVAHGTAVRVVTDGLLLSQLREDPMLSRYGTVIVDEAHERSLNIDFLLGCLARIRVRRPELRIVVASATIDAERMSAHFGGAPVISIAGRAHPVEIRWRPPSATPGTEEADLIQSVCAGIGEALESQAAGDVLAFLPGEREILECAEALRGRADVEVMPLHSRVPESEQDRIFAPGALRRVILSTNIAETSITVPRVSAVVDSGLVRVHRFSARSRIQRLPTEPVSQASAAQRAGRCGRTGPGTCIRTYAEEDFLRRPAWSDPEIRRCNLASVLLQMEALGLGDPESFPFLDPPAPRALEDGRSTLMELGAFDAQRRITAEGRSMARLPIEPRLSRMILASAREGCLEDALVIASALSVQDPRERPAGSEDAADAAHARWRQPDGDFAGLLRLWDAWSAARAESGSSGQRRWCRGGFLSHRRMREWLDVHQQLARLVRERLDVRMHRALPPGGARRDALHRSILSGFLFNAAERTREGEYVAAGGARFRLHPSSGLARSLPRWVVVAEIVETTRRWGRLAAPIRPAWAERIAPHAVHRITSEPHWVRETGQVAAWQRVTLGALTLLPRRRVPYGPMDPSGARDIFIQSALVDGLVPRGRPGFMDENDRLRERIESLERRERRPLLADAQARAQFYDARVPADVHSWPSFVRWLSSAERADPGVLRMREQDMLQDPLAQRQSGLPDELDAGSSVAPVRYVHAPRAEQDGATLAVPLAGICALDADRIGWGLEGHRVARMESLIRTLPKHLRIRLQPAREVAEGAAEADPVDGPSMLEALAAHCTAVAGTPVTPEDFVPSHADPHLSIRVEAVDAQGACIAASRDVHALVRELRQASEAEFARACSAYLATVPQLAGYGVQVAVPAPPGSVRAWAASALPGARTGWTLHATEWDAFCAQRESLVQVLAQRLSPQVRRRAEAHRRWPAAAALAGGGDLAVVVARRLVDHAAQWPGDPASAAALVAQDGLPAPDAMVDEAIECIASIGRSLAGTLAAIESLPPSRAECAEAGREAIAALTGPGAIARSTWTALLRAPAWLDGTAVRCRRDARSGAHSADHGSVAHWHARAMQVRSCRGPRTCVAGHPALRAAWRAREDFCELVREHALSVHAQEIPTARPAGPSRVERAWSDLMRLWRVT